MTGCNEGRLSRTPSRAQIGAKYEVVYGYDQELSSAEG